MKAAKRWTPSGDVSLRSAPATHSAGALRANDLLSQLGGVRRPSGHTIYETPVGRVIDAMMEAFCDHAVQLSGPVFDRIEDFDTLEREVREDVHRGLLAKTAVTPGQVRAIWQAYRPEAYEVAEARHILDPQSPAVLKMNGGMLERSCHVAWAQRLLDRDLLHRSTDVQHEDRAKTGQNHVASIY